MAYQDIRGIRIKITGKRIVFLLILFVIFSSIGFYFYQASRSIVYVNYHGKILKFRADLREANKLPVYPNESAVTNLLWKSDIKNLKIVFMNTSDLNYVGLEAFEIAYKLKIAYDYFYMPVNISGQDVASFENLQGADVFIALMPPSISNETEIRVEDNVIFIKAKNYKDFDLVTIKFLIVALDINFD